MRRQRQRRCGHHGVRRLLRFPVPAGRAGPGHVRPDAIDSRDRAPWHDRERASTRGRCRRKCGNVATHRGHAPQGPRSRDSLADSRGEPGHDEQPVVWGSDSRHGGEPFAYYETIAGGTGGGPGHPGNNGAQSHMTNTLNTPTEVLEHIYPVRVHRYALRKGSGGRGKFPGGEGIVREIEMLADVQAGILSDRRKLPPYGLMGGSPGSSGENEIVVKRPRSALCRQNAHSAPRQGPSSESRLRAEGDGEKRVKCREQRGEKRKAPRRDGLGAFLEPGK